MRKQIANFEGVSETEKCSLGSSCLLSHACALFVVGDADFWNFCRHASFDAFHVLHPLDARCYFDLASVRCEQLWHALIL